MDFIVVVTILLFDDSARSPKIPKSSLYVDAIPGRCLCGTCAVEPAPHRACWPALAPREDSRIALIRGEHASLAALAAGTLGRHLAAHRSSGQRTRSAAAGAQVAQFGLEPHRLQHRLVAIALRVQLRPGENVHTSVLRRRREAQHDMGVATWVGRHCARVVAQRCANLSRPCNADAWPARLEAYRDRERFRQHRAVVGSCKGDGGRIGTHVALGPAPWRRICSSAGVACHAIT